VLADLKQCSMSVCALQHRVVPYLPPTVLFPASWTDPDNDFSYRVSNLFQLASGHCVCKTDRGRVVAVGVNRVHINLISGALRVTKAKTGKAFALYPNSGEACGTE